MNDPRQEAIETISGRASTLADDYTAKLDEMVNGMVPKTLSNHEYAARCGGLMIALSRELARCAATFGETHEIGPQEMIDITGLMFTNHYKVCLDAIRGEGQTVQ